MAPPNAIDIKKLLRFFQETYAHALTLQELMEGPEELPYEVVRRKYDQQAAQQFELFFRAIDDDQAFSKVVTDFLDMHPEPNRRLN